MDFSEKVKSVTQDKIVPKVVDTVLGSNVLTTRLMGNAEKWSGEQIKPPVKYKSSSTGGSFSGYDTFDTGEEDTRVRMAFSPRGYYQSITLSGMKVDVNATDAQILDLIKTEMESGRDDMIDGIGDVIYGDGTGNNNKDFRGLKAAVDDTTNVTNYGGLSRSTYTTLQSSVTSVGGALSLSAMATMYSNCKVGSDKPTLIVTTESIWDDYEALAQPTVSTNVDGYRQVTRNGIAKSQKGLAGELGFDALFYRGKPVVSDEKCPSGYMWFLNEKYLKFYGLKSKWYEPVKLGSSTHEGYYSNDEPSPNHGFSWSGLKEPVNQYARIGQIIVEGDLINRNPNRSGVLYNIS